MRVVRFKPTMLRHRERLSAWVAERAFTELPGVEAVRVDSVVIKTPLPKKYRQTGTLICGDVRRTMTFLREDR